MKFSRKTVRVIAIVLVVLLAGSVVVSALFAAMAEEAPARDRYTMTLTYSEDQQALHIQQRLVFYNRTGDELHNVVFYAMPNMFRRESALMYENDDLEKVFFAGYAPGGIDLRGVTANGERADYGFQGQEELYLRVSCDIAPENSAVFEFDYYLLLTTCGAFVGAGNEDVRLGAFYFIPGVYDDINREYILKKPIPFTRWLYSDSADYEVTLSLPDNCLAAATGEEKDGVFYAENAREFALCFGKRYRLIERQTDSGIAVRVFTSRRDGGQIADMAVKVIERCEAWFGNYPLRELDIAQSDYPLGTLNYPGLILFSNDLPGKSNDMEMALRFCIAQQIFGMAAYTEPSSDAWLSDSLCEYLSYMMLEAEKGSDAFLSAINRDWVSDLQWTIPGGLRVNSDAATMDGREYTALIRHRGAMVFHELKNAMGAEGLLKGLSEFYRMGQGGQTLTEMDFVHALNAATHSDWEPFLTDWVYNVQDYVEQQIDWLN